jgi:hypothetical protein
MVESILSLPTSTTFDNWNHKHSEDFEEFIEPRIGYIAHADTIDAIYSATKAISIGLQGYDQTRLFSILPRDLWRHKHFTNRKKSCSKDNHGVYARFIVRNKIAC